MTQDVAPALQNSPYAQSLSRNKQPDSLGYSRHYAKKIREIGKTSKDSWIKRLWNHFSPGKSKETEQTEKKELSLPKLPANDSLVAPHRDEKPRTPNSDGTRLLSQEGRAHSTGHITENHGKHTPHPPPSQTSTHVRSAESRVIHPQLKDSPYLAGRTALPTKVDRGRDHQVVDTSRDKGLPRERPKQKWNTGSKKEQLFYRKPMHPYLSLQSDSWRPLVTRRSNMIQLEKKAKDVVDKAVKESKVFTCEGPYPVDVYVRHSMRKRGWVEKFGPRTNGIPRFSTSHRISCETDDDFEAICESDVPAPWEEEHGIYAVMSRLVRHSAPRFIWGGRNVSNLVLRSEVIVNHFQKARHFSSKVGITSSLRELPWVNAADWTSFFPRCYVLSNEEKEDLIEDFRLTACLAVLKWVLKRCQSEGSEQADARQGQSKYEEVCFNEAENQDKKVTTMFSGADDKYNVNGCNNMGTAECVVYGNDSEQKHDGRRNSVQTDRLDSGTHGSDKCSQSKRDSVSGDDAKPSEPNTPGQGCKDDQSGSSQPEKGEPGDDPTLHNEVKNHAEVKVDDHETEHNEKCTERPYSSTSKSGDVVDGDKAMDIDVSGDELSDNTIKNKKSEESNVPLHKKKPEPHGAYVRKPAVEKTVPTYTKHRPRGGRVPEKIIDWALAHCTWFLMCKTHADIDSKRRSLSPAQWEQFLSWYYLIVQEGANVPITEGRLKECEDMIAKMKEEWPQYELDGTRNIWIIKPGDKSKGIGIAFCDKLEDIVKFVENSTTQGTYVAQKYIERPLLIYKTKFDIRQWFLVTDWNPLTIWFYKDSYLRFCSQEYSYDTMHESIHLSNVAIQQNYVNGLRSSNLPDDNFWSSRRFREYLTDIGAGTAWEQVIYPGMRDAVVNTIISTQDVAENRKSGFELYGADFMLSEDYTPWLIEINASPGMAPHSKEKAKLCSKVIDDTIKVVLDRREDRNTGTGRFELAYQSQFVDAPKCTDLKLMVEGAKISRADLQRYFYVDQKHLKKEKIDLQELNESVAPKKYVGVGALQGLGDEAYDEKKTSQEDTGKTDQSESSVKKTNQSGSAKQQSKSEVKSDRGSSTSRTLKENLQNSPYVSKASSPKMKPRGQQKK